MSGKQLAAPAEPLSASWRSAGLCALVALFWSALSYGLIGDLYLNLRDEGYLWYGIQAVGRGDVPLRDFQSYDPGRYYWCQLFSGVFGEHVLGMRASLALFQALGLGFGLLCVQRIFGQGRWLWPAGLLLLLWMFPRFKIFESSLTLIGVWSLMRLIEEPTRKRFGLAGLCLGLAAFFGRNHGLYLGLANLALFGYLAWKSREHLDPRRLLAWALGLLLGYAPMLGMLLFVPGFATAFWHELLATARRGANLPIDYPWPWNFEAAGREGFALLEALVEQLAFVLPLLALPLGLFALVRMNREALRQQAALVAAVLVSLPYAHHYGVRSDLPHLAQAMLPMLLVLLGLAAACLRGRAWPRIVLLVLLSLHGLLLALSSHPTLKYFQPGSERQELADFDAGGCNLRLKAGQARLLERIRALVEKYVPEDAPMFIAPAQTTFYPLFQKASPVWWIYFLFESTEAEQLELIERLEARGVGWAMIDEKSFAKQERYDFRNTNPLVWKHFEASWELIRDPLVPPDYYLFRRR